MYDEGDKRRVGSGVRASGKNSANKRRARAAEEGGPTEGTIVDGQTHSAWLRCGPSHASNFPPFPQLGPLRLTTTTIPTTPRPPCLSPPSPSPSPSGPHGPARRAPAEAALTRVSPCEWLCIALVPSRCGLIRAGWTKDHTLCDYGMCVGAVLRSDRLWCTSSSLGFTPFRAFIIGTRETDGL